ncbi:MAG: extracellular solute-binding protein [Proteobacteria bacterium]|nr:extracellular solute-binding protein [Pseudomonadota bacterium]
MRNLRKHIRPGRLLVTLAVALGFLGTFGLGQANAWSLKEAAAPYAGTTINMICQAYTPCYAIEGLAPEFTEETGITVNFELTDLDTSGKKGLTDAITDGGYYDIVEVQGMLNGLWGAQGFATPYGQFYDDPALKDPNVNAEDIIPELLAMNSIFGGQQTSMPKEYFVSFGVARMDMLAHPEERANFKAKYGYDLPPGELVVEVESWDQWGDMAEFFTREKGETLAGEVLERKFYGISVSFKRFLTVWYDFTETLYAMGGELYDADYNLKLNSSEAIAALQFMLDMREFAPPSFAEYTWDEQYSDFCNGNTFSGWCWADVGFYLQIEEDCPASAHNVTHFLYPGTHMSIPYANTWVIPSSSPRKEAAYLFVQWITSKETQVKATREGWLPNRHDVLAMNEWQQDHHTSGWTQVHLTALEGGYLAKIHQHPGFQAFQDMMIEELSSAAVDGRSAEEVMNTIQEKAGEYITKE